MRTAHYLGPIDRAERDRLVAQAREILATANRERRELTGAEGEDFDRLLDQAGVPAVGEDPERRSRGVLAGCSPTEDEHGQPFTTEEGSLRGDGMNANAGLLEARTLRLGDSLEKRTRDRLLAEGREKRDLDFTFADMFRAKMIGPQTEAERRAMAATTDTTGGFIVPDILSARVIDKLRPQCAFFQAGAGSVDLTVAGSSLAMGGFITSYARLLSDPVAAAHGENQEITPSGAAFGQVNLSNHSITCLVAPVSMELAVSSPNLGDLLESSISKAMAQELDNQALLGDGAGDRLLGMFNQPNLGIYKVAGGAANGGDIVWYTDVVGARQTLLDANAAPPTSCIYSTREDRSRNAARDIQGQPLQSPPGLADLKYFYSQKLPANLTYGSSDNASQMLLGDFSQVAIGFRLGLQMMQLKERYMSQLAYGWIAVVMCDILLYHPESFVIVQGITGP